MTDLATFIEGLTPAERVQLACRHDPAAWAHFKRGFTNEPFHEEWYMLLLRWQRLCVVAPREHAKSECIPINYVAWRMRYWPGTQVALFANTSDQAEKIKRRLDDAVTEAEPQMMPSRIPPMDETYYTNGSMVEAAGAGKSVRGAHPDLIIGDDVLTEEGARSSILRRKTHDWWMGTVTGGMPHGGRVIVPGRPKVPTQVVLVGTPFHERDLLLGMRANPVWRFRRYASEFEQHQLADGWAVEAS